MGITTIILTGLAMILAFMLQACHCKEADIGFPEGSLVDDEQQERLNPSHDNPSED
jgi:hypothetical protein